MQFFRLVPKISPNLGYIFTPRRSYFKVLDPPLEDQLGINGCSKIQYFAIKIQTELYYAQL
jgi:hypothetical protein